MSPHWHKWSDYIWFGHFDWTWILICAKVVEWILGPAEKLLASQTDIGDSFKAADELRKQHEQLELKCTVSTWRVHLNQIWKKFISMHCIHQVVNWMATFISFIQTRLFQEQQKQWTRERQTYTDKHVYFQGAGTSKSGTTAQDKDWRCREAKL